MKKKLPIYLMLLLQFCLYGQTEEIFSKFPFKGLPDCISYAEKDSDSLNQLKNYAGVDSLMLSPELVKKLLIPKKSSFGKGMNKSLNSEYFALNLIAKEKKYYVLTYERIIDEVYENAETYLCTLSKKGKCISSVLIASSIYSGTGSLDDGGRFPYYEQSESCIEKNLTIIVSFPSKGEKKKYQIKNNGEIVEL